MAVTGVCDVQPSQKCKASGDTLRRRPAETRDSTRPACGWFTNQSTSCKDAEKYA